MAHLSLTEQLSGIFSILLLVLNGRFMVPSLKREFQCLKKQRLPLIHSEAFLCHFIPHASPLLCM